jgi:hypothetical protein
MKKIIALFIIILIFSSCTTGNEQPASDFGGDAVPVPFRWETDKGTYFTSTSWYLDGLKIEGWFGPGDYSDFESSPLLLYIKDAATGNDIILCSRPTCPHNSLDCYAYLPFDRYGEDYYDFDLRSTSYIFADGGYLYAHNGGNGIFRFNLDGTGRTEVAVIPNKYFYISYYNDHWLMNGKLYSYAQCYVPDNTAGYTIKMVNVLLEIDYTNGNVREIFEANSDRNTSTHFFASSEGIFYGIEKDYQQRWRNRYDDDAQRMDFHYRTENILFSINPALDEPFNIIRKGTEHEFNPHLRLDFSGENPGIYYHSRFDETIYRLDLITGESEKIAGNIPGTLFITGVFGGRIFMADFMNDAKEGFRFSIDDTGNDYYDDSTKMHETLFFVNMQTGEISESSFITRRVLFKDRTRTEREYIEGGFSGNTDGYTDIIYEEDGYFYIEIERWEIEHDVWGDGRVIYIYLHRHLIGRIPAEDYFSGNIGAIEELGWFSDLEFFEMRKT